MALGTVAAGDAFYGQDAHYAGLVPSYQNNGDGTITDLRTGLMWQQDPGDEMTYAEAVAGASTFNLAGYTDWRLPTIKELQSILDYTRAPEATDPARRGPAIDTAFFSVTTTEAWYWTGTTHLDSGMGDTAVYVAFGRATGVFRDPVTGDPTLIDVHGAGAQRSDPKSGDPALFPDGRGPQNDEIRIYNYARCVRDAR